ncbi:hypothetical protein ACROYT_G044007 [Oculina patagonica]
MAVELRSNQHKRRKDSNNNKETVKKKSKTNAELKELALQEISSLNNEIFHLEKEIFQKESSCADGYDLETLQRIRSELLESTDLPCSSEENNSSELEKEIDVLNNRLSSLETFSGIRFVENSVRMLSKTDRGTVLLRRMSGTCQRIPFVVEFEVKEDEQEDSIFTTGNKGDLKRHKRTHTGEKPFNLAEDIMKHKEIQKGDKPVEVYQHGQFYSGKEVIMQDKATCNPGATCRIEKPDIVFSIAELLSNLKEIKQEKL